MIYENIGFKNSNYVSVNTLIQSKKRNNIGVFHSSSESVQKSENKTGLSDNLKNGLENLSGMSMDDVKVHYNSPKPAQLRALAYTQGVDIHLAPGQEQHLPHEAWHVVQQKQGRVRPTVQMKGMGVNDDTRLEREADEMGGKAGQKRETMLLPSISPAMKTSFVVQRVVDPAEVTPVTNPQLYRVLVDSHVQMIDTLLRNYEEGTFFIGIGGSPELLIRSLRAMDLVPKPVLIPITELPSVQDLKEFAQEQEEDEWLYIKRIENYFKLFLDSSAKSAKKIVVLDYVSTGKSLQSAVDIIKGIYKKSEVIGQPIAKKGEGQLAFPTPLISDEFLVSMLNRDDIKTLTRTVPRVAVAMQTLGEDDGLIKEAKTQNRAMKFDDKYLDRLENREHVVREASERAAVHRTTREWREFNNPYSSDMPNYGIVEPKDVRTELPEGVMPYIL